MQMKWQEAQDMFKLHQPFLWTRKKFHTGISELFFQSELSLRSVSFLVPTLLYHQGIWEHLRFNETSECNSITQFNQFKLQEQIVSSSDFLSTPSIFFNHSLIVWGASIPCILKFSPNKIMLHVYSLRFPLEQKNINSFSKRALKTCFKE